MRNFEFDVAFVLHLDPNGATQSMDCSTAAGASDNAARLDCRMDHGETRYQIAENTPACTEWILSQVDDAQFRDCWLGQLETPVETYSVEFSFMTVWHAPRPQIVWRNSSGAVVQASQWEEPVPFDPDVLPTVGPPVVEPIQANGESIRNLIDLRRLDAPLADHDRLMLNAVAVHIWFQMLMNARQKNLDLEHGDWSTVG